MEYRHRRHHHDEARQPGQPPAIEDSGPIHLNSLPDAGSVVATKNSGLPPLMPVQGYLTLTCDLKTIICRNFHHNKQYSGIQAYMPAVAGGARFSERVSGMPFLKFPNLYRTW
jgi:hypothetical protein